MITIGIDIGSTATKAVLLNDEDQVFEIMPTGWSPRDTGNNILQSILEKAELKRDNIDQIIATGYGRESVDFADKTLTEITCHAKGASYLVSDGDLIIDVGGQDSKVIKINKSGKVLDFLMNDKCAAGTGKFLEVIATSLELDVSELDKYHDPVNMVPINSMCTVFAESEVISLLAQGIEKEKIVAGLHNSVASRVANMAKRTGVDSKVIFTGGVSLNSGIRKSLGELLQVEVVTPKCSQFAGAIGAALLARNLEA